MSQPNKRQKNNQERHKSHQGNHLHRQSHLTSVKLSKRRIAATTGCLVLPISFTVSLTKDLDQPFLVTMQSLSKVVISLQSVVPAPSISTSGRYSSCLQTAAVATYSILSVLKADYLRKVASVATVKPHWLVE